MTIKSFVPLTVPVISLVINSQPKQLNHKSRAKKQEKKHTHRQKATDMINEARSNVNDRITTCFKCFQKHTVTQTDKLTQTTPI